MLALAGRASETPGRETWHKDGHDGSYCSPGGGDMLQEGAQSSHDAVAVAAATAAAAAAAAAVTAAAAAAVAGGDGGVLGLVGGLWIGLQ